MKKSIALLIVLCMLLSFVACTNNPAHETLSTAPATDPSDVPECDST